MICKVLQQTTFQLNTRNMKGERTLESHLHELVKSSGPMLSLSSHQHQFAVKVLDVFNAVDLVVKDRLFLPLDSRDQQLHTLLLGGQLCMYNAQKETRETGKQSQHKEWCAHFKSNCCLAVDIQTISREERAPFPFSHLLNKNSSLDRSQQDG